MSRSVISFVACLLLVFYLPACSRWVVSQDSHERIVETNDKLRVDTTDSLRIEMQDPLLDEFGLGGEVDRMEESRSALLLQRGYRVERADPSSSTGPRTVARADITSVWIYSGNWGWVESHRSLEKLASTADRLRLHLHGGETIELRSWHASPDSLHGEVTARKSKDWIGIPRERVQDVSVRKTNVPVSILFGFGLVIAGGFAAMGVDALLGGCGLCWNER